MIQTSRKDSVLFFDVSKLEYYPLLRSVSDRGFLLVLNDSPLRIDLEVNGVDFRKWESFIPPSLNSSLESEIARIAQGFAKNLQHPEVQRAFTSVFGSFIGQTGELFGEQFVRCISQEISAIETLDNLARSENLRLIVLGCDNSSTERAIVLYARRLGIPTLQLAHGLHGRRRKGTIPAGGRAAGMRTLYSDYAAIFGERELHNLIEMGNDSERFSVTGSPFWDSLYSAEAQISKKEAREHLGLDGARKTVAICASYVDGASAYFPAISQILYRQHKMLLETLNKIVPDIQIILRPHPHELLRATSSQSLMNELDTSYTVWCKENRFENVSVIRNKKIETLRAADIIVTLGPSSLIVEAMILQRPVVMLPWFPGQMHFVDDNDGVLIVEDETLLPEIFVNLLNQSKLQAELVGKQQKALPEINHLNDGKATERVAELIVHLAGESKKKADRPKGDRVMQKSGKRKLKILEIVHNFPPHSFSGTELYTLHLSKELHKLGHRVTVLYPVNLPDQTPFRFEGSTYDGIDIVKFNVHHPGKAHPSDFYNPEFDEPFRNYLRSTHFDVVHFQHLFGLSASWISVAKEMGCAVFLKIDDMFFFCRQVHLMQYNRINCSGPESLDKCFDCVFNRTQENSPDDTAEIYRYLAFRRAYLKEIFSKADYIHSPSNFLKVACNENGLHNEEFHVLPTGIKPFHVEKKTPDREPEIRVAFLGHIDIRKGILDFLEAIKVFQEHAKKTETSKKLRFVIYGRQYVSDLFSRVIDMISRLDDTEYCGAFEPEDRGEIFSECDVVVMPSIGENYPFLLREALYAGVPAVATEVAGIPEIVRPGKNGFLFPPGNAAALADIFLRISKNPRCLDKLHFSDFEIKTIDEEAFELSREFCRILDKTCRSRAEKQTQLQIYFSGKVAL